MFYHADGLGSIVAITDASGNIVQRYSYEAFGQLTASDPTFDNFYTYTGREYDKETGLYYYRARYYDAMEGRFISKDPIGFAGGDVNLYNYVGGNPINYYDPLGLASVGDVAFYSWKGTQWPNHATVVTQVDSNGKATHAFGAWGDTMTFHEVNLKQYNGGIQDYIIGYGDMSGLSSMSLQDFTSSWDGRSVAPGWDGYQGDVCIDATTAVDGWGGNNLRNAMSQDYQSNPGSYRDFGAGKADPTSSMFYRRNGNLQQYFINTGRYQLP